MQPPPSSGPCTRLRVRWVGVDWNCFVSCAYAIWPCVPPAAAQLEQLCLTHSYQWIWQEFKVAASAKVLYELNCMMTDEMLILTAGKMTLEDSRSRGCRQAAVSCRATHQLRLLVGPQGDNTCAEPQWRLQSGHCQESCASAGELQNGGSFAGQAIDFCSKRH